MYSKGDMCMAFNFDEEILIIKGFTKMGFIFILVVFGLLYFNSMLFFGPSFSHLVCYFGYSFGNSMVFI